MSKHIYKPQQFEVNEAWILFQLNEDPVFNRGRW